MDKKLDIHIRWAIKRDLPKIMYTEKACFTSQWDEEHFMRLLRARDCIAMVAEHKDIIVGHMVYKLYKNRLHILRIAVHPLFGRQKVGTQMIDKLLGKLDFDRRAKLTAMLRESNLEAQLFFRSLGFLAICTLRQHYKGNFEDAYVMEYNLPGEKVSTAASFEMHGENTGGD